MEKTEQEKRETLARIAAEKAREREDRDKRFTAEMNRKPRIKNTVIMYRDMEAEDNSDLYRLRIQLKQAGKSDNEIRYAIGK